MHTHNRFDYGLKGARSSAQSDEAPPLETPEQKIAAARAIWHDARCVPVADVEANQLTPAWLYLRHTRGLPIRNLNPDVARYHPAVTLTATSPPHAALVLACRDANGEVAGIQCIFLVQRRGGRVERTWKCSRGVVKGNPVLIPPAPGTELTLACEGPEDALALRLATGGACYAALSRQNLRHVPLDHGARLVVFLDRATSDLSDDQRAIAEAARELDLLCDRGVEVLTALPPAGCKDANDAFRKHGPQALRRAVEVAQRYMHRPRDVGAPPAAPALVAATTQAGGATPRQRAAYAGAALRRECDAIRTASPGRQEATLNDAAVKIGAVLAGLGLPLPDAADQLLHAALAMPNERGRPPWTQHELRRRIQRGLEAGARRPRVPVWRR